ncbi:MAG: hypothetical protein ACXAC7_03070 [Candidatus Hodarchaeales archaeon]|jgi:hypothetical protein
MQTTDVNLEDATTLVLIIVAIVLTAVLLYLATRLVTGRKETGTGYFIRLLIVAIIIYVIAFGIQAAVGSLGALGQYTGLQPAVVVIIFTAIIYIIKMGVLPATTGNYDVWERALWIALLTVIFIFAFNTITNEFFDTPIIAIGIG